MASQSGKAERFARSHIEPGIVVLPNAWDTGSAIMMVESGFAAIATTSAGVAFAMGLPDGQHVSRDAMLECVARIVAAVPVPVTADLEAGYGPKPEDVAITVLGALEAGAAGCNIEDATGNPDKPLFDLELACDRIRAGAEAARGAGSPFVLNARGGSASALSVADLERLGVKRVSIGGSLSVAVLAFVQQSMRELREQGTFGYAPAALSNANTNAIMARYRG